MDMQKVSLILTTYNSAENLRRTLQSIDMQDYAQIEVNIKQGTVKASTDGVKAATSPLEIELREKVKGALQKLDGLSYKVKGKASHDGTTVTGINLNSEKHTLKLENIKVKLVGKVIGNFN